MNKELKADKSARSKPTRTSRTSDSLNLTAGPETFQVQITNLNKELDADSIKEFIDNNKMGIEVSNIEDRTSDGWLTKRYLLTFEYKYYEQVMSNEFWPNLIYFRRWFPARVKLTLWLTL